MPVSSGVGRATAMLAVSAIVSALSWGSAVSTSPAVLGGPAPVAEMHQRTVSFSDEGVRVDPGSRYAAAPLKVAAGSRIVLVGKVPAKVRQRLSPRPVSLQELAAAGRWRTVKRTHSARTGRFSFPVAAGSALRVRSFRVQAARYKGLAPYRSGVQRVRVVAKPPVASGPVTGTANGLPRGPSEVPTGGWDPAEYAAASLPRSLGSATDWTGSYWQGPDHRSARWNPCAVIRWAYDPTGSYARSVNDMKRAFALLAGRSGLHFKYVGAMNFAAYTTTDRLPAGVDVAVGWSDSSKWPRLAGNTVGLGGSSARSTADVNDTSQAYRIYEGYIVLDKAGRMRAGFDKTGTATWGQVMTHEAGHVVGLGHSNGSSQLMYSAALSNNHLLGAGDLTGLSRVGATRGCLS